MNDVPIKTTLLTRDSFDTLLSDTNYEFFIAITKDGQLERLVTDQAYCDHGIIDFPIPVGEITEIKQYSLTTTKVTPQAGALSCIKYCTIGAHTFCCQYG